MSLDFHPKGAMSKHSARKNLELIIPAAKRRWIPY